MYGHRSKNYSLDISKFLCFLLTSGLIFVFPAMSHPAANRASSQPVVTQAAPLNLDLSSTLKSLNLSSLSLAKPVQLNLGGINHLLGVSAPVTAAEFVAAYQVETGGLQTLTLGASGNAVSGQFSLTGTLTNLWAIWWSPST